MATHEKISELLDANPDILRLLVDSETLSDARSRMFGYLNECEDKVRRADCPLHLLEKKNTRDCITVFKSIISESNEHKTKHSCLDTLWKLAAEHWRRQEWPEVTDAFLVEMKHLFKGVIGLSGIYSKSGICKREVPAFMHLEGREAAVVRSELLNVKADQYAGFIRKNGYRSGLDDEVVRRRQEHRQRILQALGATEQDWANYRWQFKHRFRDAGKIGEIIELTAEEKACIDAAMAQGIPCEITPFYLSLMDPDSKEDRHRHDRSLRAQVIPNRIYLDKMLEARLLPKEELDFMHEMDTSPTDFVTRRYSQIAIVKPYLWCPQICIYCQRNWELAEDSCGKADPAIHNLAEAYEWFRANPGISEVLITGGDPLAVSTDKLASILQTLTDMKHIKRIRIGTRTLVTAPMRFDEELLAILRTYHRPPEQTITLVTHVQHPYEISQEMADAMRNIKSLGIDVYNQQVFTMQNCRKFETCFLRESLKGIGISPYYLFNLKGKEETADFKVPVARLLQEQKEEARLMPGLVRTDKPVFNVPTLGKNELNAWQDHEIIMILNDGSRIYEFYPWEKYMAPVNTYVYKDTPIYDFLRRLEALGEHPDDYKTIWYYF
ncbi:lysine 2,3-aminomutase [Paenibacillus tianmuensis]|uniref:Lysine 2,3-aminomutase n=1 Tax=Paenibacillus tianmuensis TaxID=624147 RepID=A0A1G4RAM7_9BACL|nr:KamA family radical SAM protein [Paenibacillus tianmuensis]SCW53299.1 lysine 2,3-aminomutase [Paenibacillus tianmuensis]